MKTLLLASLVALVAAPRPAENRPGPLENRLASGDVTVRDRAIVEVLARPDATDPFNYALLSHALWQDGRRLQASFWFYVFQARTRPWADLDKRGDGAGALRGALNEELGPTINGWLASDLGQWQAVARRALDYEARLPLSELRPDGVGAADWAKAVAVARASFRDGFEQTLGRETADDLARKRHAAGLPVGPLDAPGPPLPESWR